MDVEEPNGDYSDSPDANEIDQFGRVIPLIEDYDDGFIY